jgi:hypothetical protein
MKKEKKQINAELNNKSHFTTSKAVIDASMKRKLPHWESNPSRPHCRQTDTN